MQANVTLQCSVIHHKSLLIQNRRDFAQNETWTRKCRLKTFLFWPCILLRTYFYKRGNFMDNNGRIKVEKIHSFSTYRHLSIYTMLIVTNLRLYKTKLGWKNTLKRDLCKQLQQKICLSKQKWTFTKHNMTPQTFDCANQIVYGAVWLCNSPFYVNKDFNLTGIEKT